MSNLLIKDLAAIIAENGSLLAERIVENTQIYGVTSYSCRGALQDDTLYVADPYYISSKENLPRNLLLLEGDTSFFSDISVNFIQIRGSNTADIVSKLSRILVNDFKLQRLKLSAMDTIIRGKGLDGVLDDLGRDLRTAIVVMDISGKILSHSSPFLLNDPLWQESVERGYCPAYFVDHLRDVRSRSSSPDDAPIMRRCEENNLYYLAQRIFSSGELFGYVFLLRTDGNFTALCRNIIPYIVGCTKESFIYRDNGRYLLATVRDNLFLDILNGISPDEVRTRVDASKIQFPARMCLSTVKPKYYHGDNYVKDTLVKQLREMFPGDRVFYYQKAAVILFDIPNDAPELDMSKKEQLAELCERDSLVAGISNCYTNPAAAKNYYDQTLSAISLAIRLGFSGNVFEYKGLAPYDLISTMERSKLHYLCHPALAILRSYDANNSGQLYDTLKAYADNGFNQNLTASALFLHRNTLTYRRQKIISLTGINFDDVDTQYLLRFSFMVDEYLNKTQN